MKSQRWNPDVFQSTFFSHSREDIKGPPTHDPQAVKLLSTWVSYSFANAWADLRRYEKYYFSKSNNDKSPGSRYHISLYTRLPTRAELHPRSTANATTEALTFTSRYLQGLAKTIICRGNAWEINTVCPTLILCAWRISISLVCYFK